MALDLQSKKLLWKCTPTDRQPVFVGSSDGRYGVDLVSGKKVWEFSP